LLVDDLEHMHFVLLSKGRCLYSPLTLTLASEYLGHPLQVAQTWNRWPTLWVCLDRSSVSTVDINTIFVSEAISINSIESKSFELNYPQIEYLCL